MSLVKLNGQGSEEGSRGLQRGNAPHERAAKVDGTRDDMTGAILVGGKSRRMGRDKALLPIGGRPLYERVLDIFRQSFSRILLVGDRAERFAGSGLPVVPDIYPGSALGGLYTALSCAGTEYVFVSSCDLAFPNLEMLRFLCSLREGFDAVVPNPARRFEPLFAVYAKTCLGPMGELLERGNLCVYDFYPRVRVRYVRDEELTPLDRNGKAFMNVNTPEEFEKIIEKEASL